MANNLVVKKINFAGNITRKFAIDWSADNKISVCTDRCIYILSFNCSPMDTKSTLPLQQKVIAAPTERLDFGFFENLLPVKEGVILPECVYSIMLDRTLVPNLDAEPSFLTYRTAKWSPKGACKNGSCLLAALTNDRRLVLYEEQEQEWKEVIDLSETFYEIHRSTFEKEDNMNQAKKSKQSDRNLLYNPRTMIDECEKRKRQLTSLLAEDLTWTNMFGSSTPFVDSSYRWCYLIVAMKNGSAVWWKISPDEAEVASAAMEWNPEFGRISSMCWQQTSQTTGFLCCGTLKGELTFTFVEIQAGGREPKLNLKTTRTIWNQDDVMCIDHISILKTSVKKYVMVCTKQHYLITAEVCINDAAISIKNVGYIDTIYNTAVTGFSVLDPIMPQSRILLSTEEGSIVKAKVTASQDSIKTQHEYVEVDVDLVHNKTQGLAVSPNGLFGALFLKTAVWFDHLVKREPLQFVIFMLKPFEDVFKEFERILKPPLSFLQTPSSSMFKYIDFLECTRMYLSKREPMPALFITMLNMTESSYENLNRVQLYFIRFLLKIMLSGLGKEAGYMTDEDIETLKGKLEAVESMILVKYIHSILSSSEDKIDLLSPAQGQSLLLMGDWLYMKYDTPVSNLYEAFGHECPESVDTIPPRETCRICKLPVSLKNTHSGACENGHVFARCCLSLLLCDYVPYYTCVSCKCLALSDVWTNNLLCTFCSLPLV